jgi:ADP-heptose:LPS heptosyltransferase
MTGVKAPYVQVDVAGMRWPRAWVPGSPRARLRSALRDLTAVRPSLLVNLHEIGSLRGLLSVRYLIRRLGHPHSVGRGYRSGTRPYDDAIPERDLEGLHNVERYLRVAALVGAEDGPVDPRLEVPDDARLPAGLQSPLLCINPGGQTTSKRWPAERFAAVGRGLMGDFESVAVLGSALEVPQSVAISEAIGPRAVCLAGRLDLAVLARVLGTARLLVTNNSGPMHMAAALGTPVVAVFGSLPVETLHPWLPQERFRVLGAMASGAGRLQLPFALRAIGADEVLAACRDLLG